MFFFKSIIAKQFCQGVSLGELQEKEKEHTFSIEQYCIPKVDCKPFACHCQQEHVKMPISIWIFDDKSGNDKPVTSCRSRSLNLELVSLTQHEHSCFNFRDLSCLLYSRDGGGGGRGTCNKQALLEVCLGKSYASSDLRGILFTLLFNHVLIWTGANKIFFSISYLQGGNSNKNCNYLKRIYDPHLTVRKVGNLK